MSADPGGPLLVIDSASSRGLVGVVEGDRVRAEHTWHVDTNFSRELLAAIDAALADAALDRGAIAGIVAIAGPGGYGSLRAGVATAQGIALALDVPLAGVHRLEADAWPHLAAAPVTPVVAVHDAGRAGVAWAAYEQALTADAPPAVRIEPRIDDIEACVSAAPRGALWCGELSDELLEACRAAALEARVAPPERNVRRVLDLVSLARAHRAFDDAAALDVVYLRPPSITRPRAQ